MAIIVNTNMSALKTQKNLNNASNSLQTALERMSTGLKINKAADDAAGLYVATNLNTQISGSKVAKNNISTGNNVLSTLEGDLDVILDNLNRIRDLSVQAANSIYDESAMGAMKDEIDQRLQEIDRISLASNFNGLQLLAGEGQLAENGLRLQVGANADSAANAISLDKTFFAKTDSTTLGSSYDGQLATGSKLDPDVGLSGNLEEAFMNASSAAQYIDIIDAAIDDISSKKSTIGATMNRLDAALTSLTTVIENNTAAKSTIMDADIAEESAEYTKQQILQQTSSALLVQANQLPSLALNLIQ
ncbi:MAG TPA: flagellin FliC [Candidatus Limenecus avicola]|uniref:Flagellin n=1 Tax=Candidatus Limenecus avicola TaxID=2840847 RepID=A0A9D1N084_9CLOT|nr:flagellin FliC [Candidatus Limenecus avicola]